VSTVRVRPAVHADAAILAEMANDLNEHVGVHGRPFMLERILAHGVGVGAAFTAWVAEREGAAVGYAFFSLGYNTNAAAFYRRLGARGAEMRILGVDGERLRALAAAAP
jgi:hypothetical protein